MVLSWQVTPARIRSPPQPHWTILGARLTFHSVTSRALHD